MKKTLKMIPSTSEDRDKILRMAGDGNLDHNSWWYLHGDLEKLVGYDKATIYNMSELPEDEYRETLRWSVIIGGRTSVPEFKTRRMAYLKGIYPVEVYGIQEKCVGYFWVTDEEEIIANDTKTFKTWLQRGLVVLKSDVFGCEFAKSKYEEHSSYL